MSRTALTRICLLVPLLFVGQPASAQSILLDSRSATYGNPWVTPSAQVASSAGADSKVLVTASALPAKGDFEALGALHVQSRWPGGSGKANKLLADQARGMGANAVVEARSWQGLAFPAVVAPHGSGIAVRIADDELLRSLAGSGSSWE